MTDIREKPARSYATPWDTAGAPPAAPFRNSPDEEGYCVETAGGIRAEEGGKAVATFSNRTGAAVFHPFEGYKVMAWSVPLETITPKEDIEIILDKSLKYFE